MIRNVQPQDAEAIAAIYNHYVTNTVVTFETEPITVEEMRHRIHSIADTYPYWVYEQDGQLIGYCYIHLWKQKAAYRNTVETTVYLKPGTTGQGVGRLLMEQLIETCRQQGYHTLVACITEENQGSCAFHERLGFRPVSHFLEVGYKFGRWLGVIDYELIINP